MAEKQWEAIERFAADVHRFFDGSGSGTYTGYYLIQKMVLYRFDDSHSMQWKTSKMNFELIVEQGERIMKIKIKGVHKDDIVYDELLICTRDYDRDFKDHSTVGVLRKNKAIFYFQPF